MTRVRFAPTLSGPLYLSGARIALANHLFACRNKGHFLLRLDDLAEAGHADPVMQDLRWLGIAWHDTLFQSERRDSYTRAFEALRRDGFLYPCFESEEELRAKADFRRRRGQSTIYDRAMLKLTDKQRRDAEAGGKRPYWRFKLSGRVLTWKDMVQGRREAALAAVSDPILMQADGTPTPLFASVIDDLDNETTHIVAVDDGAANTAIRMELFEVLGAQPIRFALLPPLAEESDRRKGGNLSIRGLRADGVEPSSIATSLGIVDPVRFRLSDMVPRFAMAALLAANRMALRELPFAAVADRLPTGATETFWLVIRDSLDLLKEARGWWDVVAGTIIPPVVEGEHDLLTRAAALLPPEPWDGTAWHDWIAGLAKETGRDAADLAVPLRLALTGEETGPDLAGLLPLIGRNCALQRLEIAANG